METEFTPKFSNKADKSEALNSLIKASIERKLLREVGAMSLEGKVDNLYIAIEPAIPKTKKGIEKAINKYIAERYFPEDGGEELLDSLGFFDNEPPYNERAIYKALQEQIKYETRITEEGYREDTLITPGEKVKEIVRTELNKLTAEELNELWVFGIVVTEEEANRNIKWWVDGQTGHTFSFLLFYAIGNWGKIMWVEKPGDPITYSAKEVYEIYREVFKKSTPEDPEELENYIKRATKAINDYPNEAMAFCRGYTMLHNNFSERAMLATVKAILNNWEEIRLLQQ